MNPAPTSTTRPPPPSALARLGAAGLGAASTAHALALTLRAALSSVAAPGVAARGVVREIVVRQIFYTSVQAIGLISVVAVVMGGTLVLQAEALGGGYQREAVGRVLVAVVMRELAPLVTAVLIAGRSGTAIATELAVMSVNAEVLALASLGVDPPRYIVWPRLVASLVSVPILTIYFSALAVLGGLCAALVMSPHGLTDLHAGLIGALTPLDLPLFLVKSTGLGCLVGWLCCHHGLQAGSSPTDVPRCTSRAVVSTLIGCVLYDAGLTVLFYSWHGVHLQ